MRLTEAQRLALSGGSLFDGLQVWATDSNTLWAYDGAAWRVAYGRYGCSGSTAAHTCPLSSISAQVNFDTADYDPYSFGLPTTNIVTPTNGGGMYLVGVRVTASANFVVDSHIVVDIAGGIRRAGALGVASVALPQYTGLHPLSPTDTINVRVQNAGAADRTAAVIVHVLRVGRYP
jgi:hypothetical protein